MAKNYVTTFNNIEISYLFDMLTDEINSLCYRVDRLKDQIEKVKDNDERDNLKMKLINLQYQLKIFGSLYDKVSVELFEERGC